MPKSLFFEKKALFERGVGEVRALLAGRDITSVPTNECALLSEKYETLAKLAYELCELSRTTPSKEQYAAFATRLNERATTLKMLACGKSHKATPDEKRRQLLEEFEKRTADIKKRLRSRTPQELTGAECEALSKKYEKLALLAKSIASSARTEADEQKFSEFYEKLMCRVAELNAFARKKNKKGKAEDVAPTKKSDKKGEGESSSPAPEKKKEPTKEERMRALREQSEELSRAYESLIRGYRELEQMALCDSEREEFSYFIQYFTESAEFYEAVRKKEIRTLSPEEILSLDTKKC